MQSKKQILQKDLSFSNQIFKKNFNMSNSKSNKSSQQNMITSVIPPLVKYTQQVNQKQNVVKEIIKTQTFPNIDFNNKDKEQGFNIFSRNRNFGDNFNAQDDSDYERMQSLPPLSKLQEMIKKKYQTNQVNQVPSLQNINKPSSRLKIGQQHNSNIPTTVHFDRTQKLQLNMLNNPDNSDKILNIDSLQQSRIANESIQKENNWVLENLDNGTQFIEGQILLKNIEPLKNTDENKIKNNQIDSKVSPLKLVFNSFHSYNQPQFIDDDEEEEQVQQNIHKNITQANNMIGFGRFNNIEQIKPIDNKNQSRNSYEIKNKNNSHKPYIKGQKQHQSPQIKAKKQKKILEITMKLFNHYIQPFFQQSEKINHQQTQKSSLPNSMLINDDDLQQNYGFDKYTTRSSPIKNHKLFIPTETQNKSVSQKEQQLKILDFSINSIEGQSKNQHFIHQKNYKEILGSVLSDSRKMKLYLNYLQCQISQHNQNSTLTNNYDLLSCTLTKIQQISDGNQIKDKPKALAHSLLQLFFSRKVEEAPINKIKSFRPQVIRSSNNIRIEFDPYLKYQKSVLNDRISYLKKSLQQKNKQTQLIKLTYDGIIHNYAETLQNLAKNVQTTQKQDKMKLLEIQKQLSVNSKSQKKSNYSERVQGKMHLDVSEINRGSLQGHRFRKATFGKVPSSFRGSGTIDM